ncbi:MAG: NUDIX domain-containing protein [Candidatus Woesearchaeota archaeon]
MSKKNSKDIIVECSRDLPLFADGRIDYSDAKVAPVVNVLVSYGDEILLLKRSWEVSTNRNMWDCIGGYLDEVVEPEEKAFKELSEETGICRKDIDTYTVGDPFNIFTKSPNKIRWIVFPVLVSLKSKPKIILDSEHQKFRWIKRSRIRGFSQAKKIRDILFSCTIAGKGEKGGYDI